MRKGKWPYQRLADVCDINPGKKELEGLDKETEVTFLPMAAVSEEGKILEQEFRKIRNVIKGFTYFRENDVLLAKITPCFENGKRTIAQKLKNRIGFGSTEFHVLRPHENISYKWIFHAISKDDFRNLAKSQMTGTAGQKRVPKRVLEQYEIPIPKKDDQENISDAIETQFIRLDAAIRSLNKIKHRMERYRQSVLNSAFSSFEEEKTIRATFKIIDYRGRTPPYASSGIVHIRTSNVRNGKIILKNLKYVSDQTYEKYMTRGIPQKGDVMMTTEAPLGEVTLIPDYKFSIAQRMVILRPLSKMMDKYVLYQIMSPLFQQKIKLAKTGTTVAGISSRNFKQVLFRLNPYNKQQDIVSEIESRFSVIDKLEEVIDNSLKKAEQLRKSILKAAFEGKLVN